MKNEKLKPNWADPSTTAENERLPRWLKWVFSMPALSNGLNTVLLLQVTYYCTNILGLPAALVGTMLMASKILDAVTDLLAGYFVDRTNTRWGKARPYDINLPLTWVFTVLLFSTPSFGTVGKAAYVLIMYALINSVCATLTNASGLVYLGNVIRSDKNRMSFLSFQGAIVMIGATIAGIFVPQLVATIGTEKAGWTIIALIFGVPSAIVSSIRMFTVKEVCLADGEKTAKSNYTLAQGLKALGKNGFAIIICALALLNNAQQSIMTASTNYYFKFTFGDIGLASLVTLPSLLTPIGLALSPMISRKIGTANLLRFGFGFTILGYAIRLIGGASIPAILAGSLFIAFGTIPIGTLLSIYLLECIEYGALKTGVRLEAMLGSASTFAYKLGGGIGSGMLGLLMAASGYISGDSVIAQPQSAISMIKFVFNGVPLILSAIALVLSLFYNAQKGTEKYHEATGF